MNDGVFALLVYFQIPLLYDGQVPAICGDGQKLISTAPLQGMLSQILIPTASHLPSQVMGQWKMVT